MIIAVVGPTASGKTNFSLQLARYLGGSAKVEIISADSMQLYKGMDIGTAKVTPEEAGDIVHHQLDVLEVTEAASAAAYQKYARADLAAIEARGKIPLIVGGSGLYVAALLDELRFPGTDVEIRAELESIYETEGLAPLAQELAQKDPVSAAAIDMQNPRRVIRALEVVRLTGESYTPVFPRHTSHYADISLLGIGVEKAVLEARIAARTADMFSKGLLVEAAQVLEAGILRGSTAQKATGYMQAIAVLQGKIPLAEAVANTEQATRRLAKKQNTWFHADQRIEWLNFSGEITDEKLREAAAHTAQKLQNL